jgi:hypothetical protein
MISLTLSALLAGGASYWFFIGNQERYFHRTVQRIQTAQDSIFAQISRIANDAVRVNGFSRVTYAGIQDSPASGLVAHENLRIYRIRYPEVTAAIEEIDLSTSKKIRFKLTHTPAPVPGDESSSKARSSHSLLSSYLAQASAQPRYLAFFKGTVVNILPVRMASGSPETLDGMVNGWFEADLSALPQAVATDLSAMGEQIDSTTTVGMVEEVDFRFDSGRNLNLVEKFPDPTVEKVTMIAKEISALTYRFGFDDHQRPQEAAALNLILPVSDLQDWNASDYKTLGCNPTDNPFDCCDPSSSIHQCVDTADLATLKASLTMSARYTSRLPSSLSSDSLRLVGGNLFRDGFYMLAPAGFGLQLSDSGAAIQDADCLNPGNRCRSSCVDFYSDPNPRSPRWVGYGQYKGNPSGVVSNYCECGTGADVDGDGDWAEHFKAPETPEGKAAIPIYRPPHSRIENRQINACISHFGDIYEWAWKHPMMWFLWNAIGQGTTHSTQYVTGSFPNFVWNYQAFEDLRQNFLSFPDPSSPSAFWDEHLQCRLSWDGMSSMFRAIWWQKSEGTSYGSLSAVTQPESSGFSHFQSDHAKEGSTLLIMPVEQKCACTTSGSVFAKFVCNHGASPSQAFCPSTWVTSGNPAVGQYAAGTEAAAHEGLKRKVYRVKGVGAGQYSEGLESVTQAALCQCLNETYNRPYRDSSSALPTYEGWGVSNIWDFRVNPDDANFSASLTQASGMTLSGISGLAPLISVPGLPQLEQNFAGHLMRAQHSPHVRTVRVHYQTSDSQTAPELSESIRCDVAWRGYLGRCTRPDWPAAERDAVLSELASANPSLSEAQREVYAGFCSKSCMDELLYGPDTFTNSWYTALGVRAVRQALTNVSTPEEIPTWCGGRAGASSAQTLF